MYPKREQQRTVPFCISLLPDIPVKTQSSVLYSRNKYLPPLVSVSAVHPEKH